MHYLDLPLLHIKPTYTVLKSALDELQLNETKNFEAVDHLDKGTRQWLSRVGCSELEWLNNEDQAEELRSLAARRLAAECGVTASAARTRKVDLGGISVDLVEPGMTEDHLGTLTWGSSLILARRIVREPHLVRDLRVLELGAGTGLCGITARLVGASQVHVTDLPEIVPNLTRNVELNRADCASYVLDWAQPEVSAEFDVCIVSDPVYSREHPVMLLQAIDAVRAPVILLQLPLRSGFEAERAQIHEGLHSQSYAKVANDEERGRDLFGEQTFSYSHYVKVEA